MGTDDGNSETRESGPEKANVAQSKPATGEPGSQPSDKQDSKHVTVCDMYREGSECCRNYSKLTSHLRTLAAYLMFACAVGLGTVASQAMTKSEQPAGIGLLEIVRSFPPQFAVVVLLAGVALLLFAITLGVVNWHFSSAFNAMRDALSRMEPPLPQDSSRLGHGGPWQAHKHVRTVRGDKLATYLPFVALAVLGIILLCMGRDIIVNGTSRAGGGRTAAHGVQDALPATMP